MSKAADRLAALEASLAAQNTVGARAQSWVGETVMPFLANNAARAEVTVGRPFAQARSAIRAWPFVCVAGAGVVGWVLAAVVYRKPRRG